METNLVTSNPGVSPRDTTLQCFRLCVAAADGEAAPPSLVVEDATLHAEFRQLAVLGNQ